MISSSGTFPFIKSSSWFNNTSFLSLSFWISSILVAKEVLEIKVGLSLSFSSFCSSPFSSLSKRSFCSCSFSRIALSNIEFSCFNIAFFKAKDSIINVQATTLIKHVIDKIIVPRNIPTSCIGKGIVKTAVANTKLSKFAMK